VYDDIVTIHTWERDEVFSCEEFVTPSYVRFVTHLYMGECPSSRGAKCGLIASNESDVQGSLRLHQFLARLLPRRRSRRACVRAYVCFVCVCVYMCMCVCVRTCKYKFVCACVYVYVYIYAFIHMCMCMCMHIYT